MNDYFSENSENRNSLNRMSYGVQIESAKNEPNVVKIGEMEKNGKERELTRNATERKVPKI